jgi:hypothetical protein
MPESNTPMGEVEVDMDILLNFTHLPAGEGLG